MLTLHVPLGCPVLSCPVQSPGVSMNELQVVRTPTNEYSVLQSCGLNAVEVQHMILHGEEDDDSHALVLVCQSPVIPSRPGPEQGLRPVHVLLKRRDCYEVTDVADLHMQDTQCALRPTGRN